MSGVWVPRPQRRLGPFGAAANERRRADSERKSGASSEERLGATWALGGLNPLQFIKSEPDRDVRSRTLAPRKDLLQPVGQSIVYLRVNPDVPAVEANLDASRLGRRRSQTDHVAVTAFTELGDQGGASRQPDRERLGRFPNDLREHVRDHGVERRRVFEGDNGLRLSVPAGFFEDMVDVKDILDSQPRRLRITIETLTWKET